MDSPIAADSAPRTFVDYYRCPEAFAQLTTSGEVSSEKGFVEFAGRRVVLPLHLDETVTNLRQERYVDHRDSSLRRFTSTALVERLYYLLRPLMSVAFRRRLQQIRLGGWDEIPFPRWPVDSTVDELMQQALRLFVSHAGTKMPFIWFWPDGAESCMMLTHDVEGKAGLDFCGALMDLDQRFGMKAAFQLIPESPHDAWRHASAIRARGFEVNLHDLNHDGHLFRSKERFLERTRRINEYARRYGCQGFRSGAMYREQAWYSAFEFEYDMSVPNVAHLEPQRGGCCTVMPYFVGDVLELPLTTSQDYTLFFILEDYTTRLWREQIAAIRAKNGLVSVITHPDYLVHKRERTVFVELLEHLAEVRDENRAWTALPGEVNRWWRQRAKMTLVPHGTSWRVEGDGSDRACVAYAQLDGDRVVYSVEPRA